MGVSYNSSTPYNPRSNGKIEKRNREVVRKLKLLDASDDYWDKLLLFVVYSINTTEDPSTLTLP